MRVLARALTLALTVALPTALAQKSVDQTAARLNLKTGEYTPTNTLPALGVGLDRGALHLGALRPLPGLTAADLRAAQEQTPRSYGYRCTSPLDLTVIPSSLDDQRVLTDRLVLTAKAQVLTHLDRLSVLRAGTSAAPVLTQLLPRNDYVVVATCDARADVDATGQYTYVDVPSVTRRTVNATLDGLVGWCDAEHDTAVLVTRAYRGAVQAVRGSPDGQLIATFGWDDRPLLKIWRARDGTLVSSAPTEPRTDLLLFSGDGRFLFRTVGPNATTREQIVIWHDMASGREAGRLSLPAGERFLAVSDDGSLVATRTVATASRVRVRHVTQKGLRLDATVPNVDDLAFARGGGAVVALDTKGQLFSFALPGGTRVAGPTIPTRGVRFVLPGVEAGSVVIKTYEGTSVFSPGRTVTYGWSAGEDLKTLASVTRTGEQLVGASPDGRTLTVTPDCVVPVPQKGS
ncbi:WD40 repeat domain-containing protein [Deinococcus pimensis]|uniref:WD40 repeat domain-containing protein n=1 Tax=Deinococcus pimensis TaxID=309888 RepID=UPI00047FFAFA|nr:hypothetical protein [Deinococcus pimensis]